MVNAGERGSDEAKPQEKRNHVNGGMTKERLRQIRDALESRADTRQRGVKYAEANSLRTQQAIARFGKSARHPLCLAALEVWKLDEELSMQMKDVVLSEQVLNSV